MKRIILILMLAVSLHAMPKPTTLNPTAKMLYTELLHHVKAEPSRYVKTRLSSISEHMSTHNMTENFKKYIHLLEDVRIKVAGHVVARCRQLKRKFKAK